MVKWSRLPPVCAFLCITVRCFCQQVPAFNQAIDPTTLDLESIYQHLDTIGSHRKAVRLHFLQNEFPDHSPLTIETFFQKSETHRLLRLSSYRIAPEQLFVMAEGWGNTYLKISDQHCTVVSALITGPNQDNLLLLDKKCIY
jgi:hypothetical protein